MGYECMLGKGGGELRDTVTGDIIPLHRRDNLYVMKALTKQGVIDPGTVWAGLDDSDEAR